MNSLGFLVLASLLWFLVLCYTACEMGIAWKFHAGSVFWRDHKSQVPQHILWWLLLQSRH